MSFTNMLRGGGWGLGEWPDYIEVVHDACRGESRIYVPERTCRIYDTDHGFEDSICCDACQMTFRRPWQPFKFCPNCGAKVENMII